MIKQLLPLALSPFLLCHAPIFSQNTKAAETKAPCQNSTSLKEEISFVMFTPPSGWSMVDLKSLPLKLERVKVMVVGSGSVNYAPRLTLSVEPYAKSLKDYLKMIKKKNAHLGADWKDLGVLKTALGNASLSQLDSKAQWGELRRMDVILLHNEQIYVLTATALKDEFHQFYQEFFSAMRSLRLANNVYDAILDNQLRQQLELQVKELKQQWAAIIAQQNKPANLEHKKVLFENTAFQNQSWKPFVDMLNQKFSQFGLEWQMFFLEELKNQLIDESSDCQTHTTLENTK